MRTRRGFLTTTLGAGAALGIARASSSSFVREDAPKAKKKILVLGGTRLTGPPFVELARSRGHEVTLFNRGNSDPKIFQDVEQLRGDRDPKVGDGLKALEGDRRWDLVLDTSTQVPRVLRASAELLAKRVDHYLFVSSLSALVDLSRPGADESAPVQVLADPATEDLGANFENYGGMKALCEKTIEEVMPGRSTSVRPGLIVGPRDGSDRFTYWPVRVARGGEVLAPGTPKDPIQIVDARDLAAFYLLVLEQKIAGLFNAVGPEKTLGLGEMLETCKRVSKSDATFTWVEPTFLEEQKVMPWSDLPAWIPSESPDEARSTVICTKAIRAGLKFRPLDETVADTLAWWNSLPEERRAKPRTGLTAEREAATLAAWHARASK